ncbi:MAG: FAD-dependent monooxygenase [Betaproteobacteria bacterium]|jgi:2-octaprenyl-6-methoxyphenol hydroxylase
MSHVLVIGAGPVGATFALLAKAHGLDVSLIDARKGPSTETRTLALSHGSRILLEKAGVWGQALQPTEIHAIHTSHKGGFGRVMLRREDASVPALGYVVAYAALQDALDRALAANSIQTQFSVRVQTLNSGSASLTYADETGSHEASGDVIVMADGGANLDKLPSISLNEKDYGQSAMLAHLVADRDHRFTAYERFTPQGPAALLPAYTGTKDFSMVWVASHETIDELMTLDDDAVRARFQTHFGRRAGQFVALGQRRRYPLTLRQVSARVVDKVVMIGNAAQAMHPVAGQGFNLGLRDAATLANAFTQEADVQTALRAYAQAREPDISTGIGFTDLLASAFMGDSALLRWPRGAALAAVDMLPAVRRALADRMLFGAQR